MNVIRVKDVHKKFKIYFDKGASLKEKLLFWKRNRHEDIWVLKGINLEVEKGEAVGLIGQNGCGKSTLLKLLTKIMYPDKGTIEVAGRVSSLIELGAGFHPDMTGRENIYTNAAIFGLTRKEIEARMEDIIAFSELEDYLDSPVRVYSSGMYMRLAFSVAINVDADILLIDEILAVGDANFQTKCFNKLRELKARGVTIVIVTHDTGVVEKFCDQALWINDGVVQAEGKSKDVVDRYMKFMNDQLYERMQAEEDQRQEKEAAEWAAQEEKAGPDPEAGQGEKKPEAAIDYSANRFGLMNAEITDAGFLDENGNYTYLLRGGEPARLEIQYKINKPIEEYVFGMGFFTMDSVCIYGTNTMIDGLHYKDGDIPRAGRVLFHIDKLPLLQGKYILHVSIVDRNGVPMDYWRRYAYFDVVAYDRAVGIMEMPHEWALLPAEAASPGQAAQRAHDQ